MDRYQKVEKPRPEVPMNENEIRITAAGLVRNYLTYATTLLQERRGREIVLKAMGNAISKTVAIAEIIKRRIPQLHQDTAISSVKITDVYEPIEEGLSTVEQTRQVSMISITLSFKELNKDSPGYQAPSYAEQRRPQYNYQQQPRQAREPYNAVNEDSYGRGRGRGRGRERGWNRGGYGNYQGGNYQENSGYSNWGRGGGHGYGNYQENDGHSNFGRGGGRGYGNYQENDSHSNFSRGGGRGYGNYQENDGHSNFGRGGGRGYGNYQENDDRSNFGRGGGRGRSWGYRDPGYETGRGGGGYETGRGRDGGGGRGYGRGRGRMVSRPRGGGNQA